MAAPATKKTPARTATKRTKPAKRAAAATGKTQPRRRPAAVKQQPARPLKPAPAPAPDPLLAVPRQWPGAPVHRSLGVALLGLAGAGRFTGGASPVVPGPGGELPAEPVLDVALGVLDLLLEGSERVAGGVRRYVNPVLTRAWAPAAGPVADTAGTGLRILAALTEPLAERGRRLRADSEHEAAAAVAGVLPETIQLTMEQLDLTELAIEHVDVQRVMDEAVQQIDFTQFAIDNVDLERVIEASLDAVDFTGVAIERMDFARALTAALDQVDVLALAREGLDPAKVTAYLLDQVDIAETLRTAPGAVAGEAVRGMRGTMGRIVRR